MASADTSITTDLADMIMVTMVGVKTEYQDSLKIKHKVFRPLNFGFARAGRHQHSDGPGIMYTGGPEQLLANGVAEDLLNEQSQNWNRLHYLDNEAYHNSGYDVLVNGYDVRINGVKKYIGPIHFKSPDPNL